MAEEHRENSGSEEHSKPLSGLIYLRTDSNGGAPRPSRRRHRFTVRFVRCFCAFFIALLCVVGVAIFVAWISIRPHKPRVFLDYASVSEFNISQGALNARMNFNISLRNSNEKVGIYYDTLVVEAIYSSQKIASGWVPKFYQDPKNTTVIRPNVEGKSVFLPAEIAAQLGSDSASGKIRFDLKLKSKTRFKVSHWTSKSFNMRVKCDKVLFDFTGHPFRQQQCMVYF